MRDVGPSWWAASCCVIAIAAATGACREPSQVAKHHASDPSRVSPDKHARTKTPPSSSLSPSAIACASCHRAEAEEWNGSLHHTAFSDADFQASFNAEPLAFCFDCHAPEAKRRSDVRGAEIGVGCASCHSVADGHGANTPTYTTATTTTNCGSCHEFAFPGRTALMQSTMTEHAQSPLAAVSCASCHLPRAADGHRDHRFDVSRNAELLRAAIDVRSQRTAEGVEIVLTTRHVGHAMPTGDLFRRLRIAIVAEAPDGRLLGEDEVLLTRRFDRARGAPTQTHDDRVFGERRVHIDGAWLTGASRISIEVRYERVAQTIEIEGGASVGGEHPRREALFASIVLAQLALGSSANQHPEAHSTR